MGWRPRRGLASRHGADSVPTQFPVPVVDGRLWLGAWQGIYLFEHRSARHLRQVVLHAIGE